jgi:hypothetical protein
MLLWLALVAVTCSREGTVHACPGQSTWRAASTDAELSADGLPPRGATTLVSVRWAAENARASLHRNFVGVMRVDVGAGWGVTYSVDSKQKISFHRAPDHLVVVTLGERSECPTGPLLNHFVEGKTGGRVPVRFLYRSS